MKKALAAALILAFGLAVPGSPGPAAARAKNEIRVATLAPKNTELSRGFLKIDRELKKATNGKWGIHLYANGIAGDEKDVIRKMRIGQMDASLITTTGLSQLVPEVAVLNAPGVINDYKQLERVLGAMVQQWNKTFNKAGFKLISWGESGQYRYFSQAPINKPSDLKSMRPWLWNESHVMKEIYLAVGATGVPLGVREVYGALQTRMVNAVMASSLAVVALQWHAKLNHVTTETSGVLLGAMIINDDRWKAIPADVQVILEKRIKRNLQGESKRVRKSDLRAYKRLVERGYNATSYSPQGRREYDQMVETVLKRMTGRFFSKELLKKVIDAARGH